MFWYGNQMVIVYSGCCILLRPILDQFVICFFFKPKHSIPFTKIVFILLESLKSNVFLFRFQLKLSFFNLFLSLNFHHTQTNSSTTYPHSHRRSFVFLSRFAPHRCLLSTTPLNSPPFASSDYLPISV